jgi:RHS repeat-associated protein
MRLTEKEIGYMEREVDVYGNSRKLVGEKSFCPYLYQGQYEDVETGLAYNRFRYYDSESGGYISQDPIRLEGGMTLYGYVQDTNGWVDVFGLSDSSILGDNLGIKIKPGQNYDAHHIIMSGSQDNRMKALKEKMNELGIDINSKENGIWLPRKNANRVKGDLSTAHKGSGLHGKSYKQEIYDRLINKNTEKNF